MKLIEMQEAEAAAIRESVMQRVWAALADRAGEPIPEADAKTPEPLDKFEREDFASWDAIRREASALAALAEARAEAEGAVTEPTPAPVPEEPKATTCDKCGQTIQS